MTKTLLTTEQIGEKLQINPQVVRRKIREEKIEHYRVGNRIRVDIEDFLRMMKKR